MGWQVRFIPNEVTSMSVSCDGVPSLVWQSAEGDITKNVPPQFANLPHVHFVAEGSPNGRNASCQILFDGAFRHQMDFDNGEDFDS